MILVDTIVKMDTVYIEKVNNYMSKGEVLDLFDKVHSFHNDEYNKFLIILSILLVVLGFIAVFFTSRRIAATEERLNRDAERNEARLNREIDHIRGESRRFQEGIDDRIETKLTIKFEEYNIQVNELINNAEETLTKRIIVASTYPLLLSNTKEIGVALKNNDTQEAILKLCLALINIKHINDPKLLDFINYYVKEAYDKFKNESNLVLNSLTIDNCNRMINEYVNYIITEEIFDEIKSNILFTFNDIINTNIKRKEQENG